MGLFPKDRDLTRAPDEVVLEVRASDYGVRRDELCLRLDAFLLRHLSWRSRNSIQELIKGGFVAVDVALPDRRSAPDAPARETRPARRLYDGSTVVVTVPEELRVRIEANASSDLDVLWEDDWLIAIDKPPDVPVHPSGRHLADTIIQRVHARYGDDDPHGQGVLRLCHRLDKETSGVLLVARERRAHARLSAQFERRRVHKEYLALVHGAPDRDEGVVDLPLGPARTSAIRMKIAVAADGQESRTRWRVVERVSGGALISLEPLTGRQHQLRVHLEALGHPIVGDKMYGVSEEVFLRHANGETTDADRRLLQLPRQALHNHRLSFRHPVLDEDVEVVSPLPRDMAAWLEEHRVDVR